MVFTYHYYADDALCAAYNLIVEPFPQCFADLGVLRVMAWFTDTRKRDQVLPNYHISDDKAMMTGMPYRSVLIVQLRRCARI
jgi:hypothetical protein